MNERLSLPVKVILGLLSFFLVAFGQPAWLPWAGLIVAALGYALFWRILLDYSSWKTRFSLSLAWFFCVQLVQLSWFVFHPFLYIWGVFFGLCFGMAFTFGIIGIFITPTRIKTIAPLFSIAALWTIFEWSRLFILSGFSFNPTGLSLAGNLYSLQMASLFGVFGMSFWVMLVNLFALRAWIMFPRIAPIAIWITAAAFPYIYGVTQIEMYRLSDQPPLFKGLLVQTAFPVEETEKDKSSVSFVLEQWRQILEILKNHRESPHDLIVLPEFVVAYGTYSFIYPLNDVIKIFSEVLGLESLSALPQIEFPLATIQKTPEGVQFMLNNAFWVQSLANYFKSDVLIGLEDAEQLSINEREYYSAALFFHPLHEDTKHNSPYIFPERYEKRILVPMGEYIPFAFCRDIAAGYGVCGSFTHGKEAKIMNCNQVPFSPSICYEETFGDIMREGPQKGARLLVNITNDAWYPDSRLPRQHFEHARVRTVENGVPLIRACNNGITGAIDCFGRNLAVLGGDNPEAVEWVSDALPIEIPMHTYSTLYTRFGDALVISLCFGFLFIDFVRKKKNS